MKTRIQSDQNCDFLSSISGCVLEEPRSSTPVLAEGTPPISAVLPSTFPACVPGTSSDTAASTAPGARRGSRQRVAPSNRYLLSLQTEAEAHARLAEAKKAKAAADASDRAKAYREADKGQGRCHVPGAGGKRYLWNRDDATPDYTAEQIEAQLDVQCALADVYCFKSQAAQDYYRPNAGRDADERANRRGHNAGVLLDSSSKKC